MVHFDIYLIQDSAKDRMLVFSVRQSAGSGLCPCHNCFISATLTSHSHAAADNFKVASSQPCNPHLDWTVWFPEQQIGRKFTFQTGFHEKWQTEQAACWGWRWIPSLSPFCIEMLQPLLTSTFFLVLNCCLMSFSKYFRELAYAKKSN